MKQISGQDAIFLYMENETVKTHFSLLTIYDQSALDRPLRYRDILAYFEERMRGLPFFKRKLYPVPFELDSPYFVDDPNFNIDAHVHHIALPKPGDWRQFCILASQIHVKPIDMNRPLWDMHVVEGLDEVEGLAPGSFAILTRLHHAIADGTTARGVLTALHHPAGKEPPPLAPLEPVVPPTLDSMAINAMLNNWQQIAQMPMRLAGILPGAPALLGKAGSGLLGTWLTTEGKGAAQTANDVEVPATPFNEAVGHRRVFQIRRYPLAAIKRMRERVPGSTMNDVVLTLIGGAMARYLEASGATEDSDLVAACPINLREDKLTNESHLGNNISIMRVNLRTRTRSIAERLAGVHAATVAAKLAQNATAARELIELSKATPNLLMASSLPLVTALSLENKGPLRVSNCVITNVPGPQEPLYFMGARLELFTAVGPTASGTGVFFAVSSYCGNMAVSFTAGDGAVKDPQLLAECLDESFAELVAATTGEEGRTAAAPSVTSADDTIRVQPPVAKVRAKRAVGKKGSAAPA